MKPKEMARMLRRNQTEEEQQLWKCLRAGRFAGFKFRRQHFMKPYFLDFYCVAAKLCVELDGFQHGHPESQRHDQARQEHLESLGIEVMRFWNHQWRTNREGVLLEIWRALHVATGRAELDRKKENHHYIPPDPNQIIYPANGDS